MCIFRKSFGKDLDDLIDDIMIDDGLDIELNKQVFKNKHDLKYLCSVKNFVFVFLASVAL